MNNLAVAQSAGLSIITPGSPPIVETLQGLLTATWRRRYLIGVPIVLLPILGGVVGHFAPKTYETKMTILIQEPGKLNPFLEDLSVKTNLKDRMPALTALLTSRHVLQSVLMDLGLVKQDSPDKDIDRLVSDLSAAVSVTLIGQELVELHYKASSPAAIDKVMLRIGERFMERVEAPEDSSMRGSVTFLEKELADASKRLDDSEGAVAEYRAQHAASLPDQRGTNLQRLSAQREMLADHEVKLAGAQAEFDETRARLAQTDPVIGRLEQEIVATRGDLAVLRSRYTDEHSKVQAAARKLQRLEDERSELVTASQNAKPVDMDTMWNMAAVSRKDSDGSQPLMVSQVAMLEAQRTHLEQMRIETENLRRSVAELSANVEASGDIERELDKRQRAVGETLDLVQTLRKRFEMAKVTGALSRFQAPERIKVIDMPTVPTKPAKPLTVLFAAGGIGGGIFLGAGLAVLLELSDSTVRRIREMEKLTGVPVLGRLAVPGGAPPPGSDHGATRPRGLIRRAARHVGSITRISRLPERQVVAQALVGLLRAMGHAGRTAGIGLFRMVASIRFAAAIRAAGGGLAAGGRKALAGPRYVAKRARAVFKHRGAKPD